ncbi:MAG TPA: hypothetical protein VFU63_02010 [Ktedonobacterales bacterium]|nr:hypothetical protein [Ktedonobacterales bacterium]
MTNQREGSLSQSRPSPVPRIPDQAFDRESRDSEAAALQQELDTLRASYQQEIIRLRAEMAAQISSLQSALVATVTYHEALSVPMVPVTTADALSDAETSVQQDDQREDAADGAEVATSRRALLKWGGLAAAAGLAAAGGATLTSPAAHASDGGSLVLGSATNTAEHVTAITYNGAETNPVAFKVSTTASNSTAVRTGAGSGVSAYGVYGTAGTNGTGVLGLANGSSSYGVLGESDSGYGVVGSTDTGIDLSALGAGRIWQRTASFTGAPTTGTHFIGEQIRDQAGNLYICVAGGSPGTWKQVLTLSSSVNGGLIGFLSTPIRVYDSRKTGGPLVGNATRTVQVAGVTISGVQVPAGSVGCIGNLTVTGPTAGGYVVIYPTGSPTPTTSTVNFLSGQPVANSFAVGLSTGGQVTVHSFTSGQCHFIVDITGFVS